MQEIFLEIGIIIITAGILAILAKALHQPRILAYILTGIILGPFILGIIKNQETTEVLANLGITFLLFLVGLELDLRKLKDVGISPLIICLAHMVFTGGIGFALALAFGFSFLISFYISLALIFSSTVIVVKLLSEKHETDSLYGRIAISFLLIQDIIAILALIILAGFYKNGGALMTINSLSWAVIKGLILFIVIIILARYFLPYIFKFVARSSELLFLTSITWCFIIVLITSTIGLSIEIGAFLAGISLASLPYNFEIIARVRSLRDFFIILFFVTLGMQVSFILNLNQLAQIIVLSLFVLIFNPLVVIISMGLLGYKKRTSFLTGISVAQISEFSLIIIALGYKLNHLSQEIVSLITLIGATTIIISTYFITYADNIYNKLAPFLIIFERKNINLKDEKKYLPQKLKNHVIVVGYHRIGHVVVNSLRKIGVNFLVVDFDPQKINQLAKEKIPHLYGDITDPDILEKSGLSNSFMVISTVPKREDDLFIIKKAKDAKKDIIVFATADQVDEALELYDAGADYVILPHILGGEHAALLIEKMNGSLTEIVAARKHHIKQLKNINNT